MTLNSDTKIEYNLRPKGFKNGIQWKKISEELCVMTLKVDANFKGKLTCGLKNNKEFG